MAKLDERRIIEIFQSGFGNKKFVSEDVEMFKIGKKFGVIKTDTLVASTDVPPRMKIADVARKSIVASVSDFAAKGVRPHYGIISVSLPRDFSESKILQLMRGFKAASREFGFKILGGDTNQARELVISVTLIGLSDDITPRKGARDGDIIIVSGPFGFSAAGIQILMHKKRSNQEFKKRAARAVFRPIARLGFGIQTRKLVSSAMDSSDGLSTCLVEMAKQSKKQFVITKIPSTSDVEEFAHSNGLDFLDLVFNGGEEYEIVATTPKKNLGKLRNIAKLQKINLIEIGSVQRGSGVFIQKGPRRIKILDKGWIHFAN
ncbi:MAG: thiamine-phosphate kinase [Thermoproteota archaeon]